LRRLSHLHRGAHRRGDGNVHFNCILREEEHSIWPLRVLAVIVVAARLLFGGDAMVGGKADERADNKVVAQELVMGVLA